MWRRVRNVKNNNQFEDNKHLTEVNKFSKFTMLQVLAIRQKLAAKQMTEKLQKEIQK